MTSRAGEPFEPGRALTEIGQLLTVPLPPTGLTTALGDPATGEWTATQGPGFRIVPLWEGDPLTGVYAPEWNGAEEAAEAHLATLVSELDRLLGPHTTVPLHEPLRKWQGGAAVDPLYEALFDEDLYGDLTVWSPADATGPAAPAARLLAVTVGHSDGDAPLVLAALVCDRALS
ncbi:hypothetical protein ACFY9H_30320 [Streptomyces bacillaris]|uniref:Uncharacterized protein n=1 Tax=Streptomyces cavourensis TaxID=67258 RepID=A0AAD0Q859_9ACTN|nr:MULTISPECIES: hypothetical protein [Streptomyces]NUW21558.1 hypothetical protein [Streptomyces roseoviolaceus]ATY98345.1 hypothetical protein CVT27_24900 [Streptomyces cavourensis]AXI74191.1 hypothetical protein DTW94_25130 [Streptomyces cavourensis]NUV40661.1 hypothetical protein [Streptomyces sp. CAI-24]NUV87127.1 hypothetical protein [Streptomyces sp. KAI-26]